MATRKTGKVRGLGAGLALLLLLLGQAALAMAPIQHWQTANGARVYFVPAPELPMLDIRVVFDAGSARDGDRPGLARLTSSLLDSGAGGLSADQIAERLEGVGARLGSGALRDMAWVSLRSLSDPQRLDAALAVFTKVLAEPEFPPADLARERERMLVGLKHALQRPGEVASRAFYRALYGDHPYASPPSGTPESVRALRREQVLDFYRRYYVARNAVIAIVGDLDRAAAERLAASLAGRLASGERAPPLPQVADLLTAREERIPHPSTQAHVLMGQPGLRRGDPDYFALYVGNYILGGGGLVSRISEEIREKRGLSYSAYSYFMPMARRGPFVLGLQTRSDQADEALSVLRETLRGFVAEGPTAAELEAAKKHITGGYALRIDSNGKILEYLAMIGFYGLPLDYLETFNARIEAVGLEQVRDAFRRRVQPARMVTVIVGSGD
ncbi:pitrilysin family protein [Thiohalobacter sp. IOR34]|uniref:M16 family metallopeptidase n=1 Tax=Thiohalobacter sp. IOR34 TaxID=3057176 RepID=UPI0025B0CCAD|nr:pitrilysin family protein [Thiohalobacter sp. IOR34]WJW75747.1 pitrilysin family protein [Thiohalobacter sp. IOR34]